MTAAVQGVSVEMVPINDLIEHPDNPRNHVDAQLVESIMQSGFYGVVIRQRSTGYILVGNGRTKAAREAGYTELPVQTLDLDDANAKRLLLRDNRLSDLASYDEASLVSLLQELTLEDGGLLGTGYTLDDLEAFTFDPEEDEQDEYTRRTDSVQYTPTGERPPITTLVNRAKTDTLTKAINAADVPADVRAFLIAGAQRHLVFDYAKIAEFYAHAEPDVQALMEASALVIVDFNDAILHGYVRLSQRLAEIRAGDRALHAQEAASVA